MKILLLSENETYLVNEFIRKNNNNNNLYILNTLFENQLSVTMLRNMLFQKQIFGFYSKNNEEIKNIALFLYPSGFEETKFLQVLYLSLDNTEFIDDIKLKLSDLLEDDINKIKLIINDDNIYQINLLEKFGFINELSIDLGKIKRLHFSYFVDNEGELK